MAVTPLRITGSAPPGSPFQTVWWPTRTPATSVMALWVPVGRNPTGIPKSRALPRAGGGDDTDQLGFVAELLQLDVPIDLDVTAAVPAPPGPTWRVRSLITVGQARSRPAAQPLRANWSVIARHAVRMAMMAPIATIREKVSPKEVFAASSIGVAELTKALMSGTPKTTSRKVPSCKAIPIEAARTTARPTCLASPSVSSEKLMALS